MSEQIEETTETTVPETSEALSGESVSGPLAEEDSTESVDEITTTDETFPRSYVAQLRDESAKYRTKAQRVDDLAVRLHTAIVTATGRLADPTDLTFEEGHLDDENALREAIDDLLSRKPHLASRKPSGDVGQGASTSGEAVDLAGILRSRAS